MDEVVRIVTNARRGRAAVFNGTLYVGGQAADDHTLDILGQTREALAKLEGVLNDAGSGKDRLLTVQIWLKDISRDFAGMNTIWDEWIDTKSAPARATAQCELGAPDALIEIIAIAAV